MCEEKRSIWSSGLGTTTRRTHGSQLKSCTKTSLRNTTLLTGFDYLAEGEKHALAVLHSSPATHRYAIAASLIRTAGIGFQLLRSPRLDPHHPRSTNGACACEAVSVFGDFWHFWPLLVLATVNLDFETIRY